MMRIVFSIIWMLWMVKLQAESDLDLVSGVELDQRLDRSVRELCQAYSNKIIIYYDEAYLVTGRYPCQRRLILSTSGFNVLVQSKETIGVDATIIKAISRGSDLHEEDALKLVTTETKSSICRRYEGQLVPMADGFLAKVDRCRLRPVVGESILDEKLRKQQQFPVLSPYELSVLTMGEPYRNSAQRKEDYWENVDLLSTTHHSRLELFPSSDSLKNDTLENYSQAVRRLDRRLSKTELCRRYRGEYLWYFEDLYLLSSSCRLILQKSDLKFLIKLSKKKKTLFHLETEEFLLLPVQKS
jgi:hypothetical protein